MTKRLGFAQCYPAVQHKLLLGVPLVVCTVLFQVSAVAQQGTFITFEAPGARTEPSAGTFPFAIDPAGAVTGTSCSAAFTTCQGFLRAPDGNFTTFPATAMWPSSINPAGAITGASSSGGGFLRAPNGTIKTFDAPDLGF